MLNTINSPNNVDSRLLTNSNSFRNKISVRNLYVPESEYPNNGNDSAKVADAINSINTLVQPFRSNNFSSSFIGRISNPSPLTEIGSAMLIKQLSMNIASILSKDNLPTIDLSNAFDGNKDSKVFTFNVQYKITKTDSGFLNFVNNVTNIYSTSNYPFTKNSINEDYLNNTGEGQLSLLYTSLNKNIYKQSNSTLYDLATNISKPILSRNNVIDYKYFYFRFNDNPYNNISGINSDNIETSSYEYKKTYTSIEIDKQEYAPNSQYVRDNFGTTNITKNDDINLEANTEFKNDDINSKLIWGYDGISEYVNNNELRGEYNKTNIIANDLSFGVRTGLLEYTRNLLNATSGYLIDITKKMYKNGNSIQGFNGSGLWSSNNSDYFTKRYEVTNEITGVRQHTILDPYNTQAKLIRFNGNNLYNGNADSVIYDRVLPRIHPIYDNDKMNNENLMLSIENLAVHVKNGGDYGIIDDDNGYYIPKDQIGINGGRLMWFVPYNLEFNETSTNKTEAKTIIGRSEPIYNHIGSERTGMLSFTLLIDHPINAKDDNGDFNSMSKFFSFGGNPYDGGNFNKIIDNKQKTTNTTTITQDDSNDSFKGDSQVINIYFPNDSPKSGHENEVVNYLYNYDMYGIIDNLTNPDAITKTSGDVNKDIFFITGLTSNGNTYTLSDEYFDQYSYIGTTGQFGKECTLNKLLLDYFKDEDNRQYYDIIINVGTSSPGSNNDALGKRRIDSAKFLIKQRLSAMGIELKDSQFNDGSINVSKLKSNESNMYDSSIIKERYASIQIVRNSKSRTVSQPTQLVSEETKTVKYDGSDLYKKLEGDIILNAFKSTQKNYFYPVFNSQTPEDFHDRLTFLHQCTRQGSTIKQSKATDENGVVRAKNSIFGRQPICVLRIGDFINSKIIIDSVNIDYKDATWDLNPEGMGVQPMMANVTLNIKILGGESMSGIINAIQNANSYNYYANSTFRKTGIYKIANDAYTKQKNGYSVNNNSDSGNT